MRYVIKLKLQVLLLISGFTLFTGNAYALEQILCLFAWEGGPGIRSSTEYKETIGVDKHHSFLYELTDGIVGLEWTTSKSRQPIRFLKKVRKREYDRLIEAGKKDARVSGSRGDKCTLNHPENTRIDARLDKQYLSTSGSGSVDCESLNAEVQCFPYIPGRVIEDSELME